MKLFTPLQAYTESLTKEFDQITAGRKTELEGLSAWIRAERQSKRPVKLTFICTHNSRRSHMGQIWSATAAVYYNVDGIETFSGGTEVTAFNPRAVAAMKRAGFAIEATGEDNPVYRVQLREGDSGILCFSKKYDDPANPNRDFAAIMTCSQADADCPVITGASLRLPLPYRDPKEADGTAEESARYDERCRQIGREMMYVFSKL